MGLFDDYVSGVGLGGPPQPSGLGGLFGSGIAGYVTGYPYAGQQAEMQTPMTEQEQMMRRMQAQQQVPISQGFMNGFKHRKVKHVESRTLTPRERARKQINGAVQAVKDARNG